MKTNKFKALKSVAVIAIAGAAMTLTMAGGAKPASARVVVGFGLNLGGPAYYPAPAYPAYPYAAYPAYPYPAYPYAAYPAYPYYGPSVGLGIGVGGWYGGHYGGHYAYRGGGGFRGGRVVRGRR